MNLSIATTTHGSRGLGSASVDPGVISERPSQSLTIIIVVLNNEFISSFYYKSLGTAFSHKAGGPGNKEHFFALTGMAQLVGASSHGLKGQEFNSQSGHVPRLQDGSLVRVHERGN